MVSPLLVVLDFITYYLMLVQVTLPSSKTVFSHMSDSNFKSRLIRELKEVTNRFAERVWDQALGSVKYPVQANGQIFELLSIHKGINRNQLEQWIVYSQEYGYGAFHQMVQLGGTASDVQVSTSKTLILCETSGGLLRSKFLGTFWP